MLKRVFISRESWTETSNQYKRGRKGGGVKGWRSGRRKKKKTQGHNNDEKKDPQRCV